MTDEELERRFRRLESQIKQARYDGTWLFICMLLFLNGCFKGCGY